MRMPLNKLPVSQLRLPLGAAVFCGCLAANLVAATTYYVNDGYTTNDIFCATAGVDSNDGLTTNSPVASLDTILKRYTLSTNDTVYIDAGTYFSTSNIVIDTPHGGTYDGYLTIQGAGRATVLDRQSCLTGACCLENFANYVRIRNLTFTGADVGLSVYTSCEEAEILENTFFGNNCGVVMVQPRRGSFTIANNLLYNNQKGLCFNMLTNMLANAWLKVCNNTILVTNGTALVMGNNLTHFQGFNNILVAEGGGVCFEGMNTNPESFFYSDYNDFWAYDGGAVAKVPSNGAMIVLETLADWQYHVRSNYNWAWDTHSFSRDPAFAAPAAEDFHLKSKGGRWHPFSTSGTDGEWIVDNDTQSPCVDNGSPYYLEGLALEPDPNGGRMNLGAYGGTAQASLAAPGRALLAMAPDWGLAATGTTQSIMWSGTGLGWWQGNATVHIDYSLDGGNTWQTITNAEYLSVATGSFDWNRPSDTFGSPDGCWIRVVSNAEPSCMDAVFLPNRSNVAPTQFYVNDGTLAGDVWCSVTGDDGNDGLSGNTPMATIQAVIDRYSPSVGATIYVDAGNYPLSRDLVIPDTGAGNSPTNWFQLIGANRKTILNRQYAATGSCCIRVYQDFIRIEGFLFRGAETGVWIEPTSCRNAKIVNNTFTENSGFGVDILSDTTSEGFDTYYIDNNLLYSNGGGLNLQTGSGNHLAYCYVRNNTIAVYGGVGIACGGRQGGTYLYNNIVTAKGLAGICLTIAQQGPLADSDYNDFFAYGGASLASWYLNSVSSVALVLSDWHAGTGMDAHSFSREPFFVASASGDFHLRSQGGSWRDGGAWVFDAVTSPCLDAGNPSHDYSIETADNGARINMGAYGNTSEASKSTPKRAIYLRNPRGGETWPGGSTQSVSWVSSGGGWTENDNVCIEYSADGKVWSVLPGASGLSTSGSFTWTVTNPSVSSVSYYLRVVVYNQDSTLLLFDATPSAVVVKRSITTYYVNDNKTTNDIFCTTVGLDTNTGKSPDQPLLSLSEVLKRYRLGAGDTVYVDAGDYVLQTNIVVDMTHGGAVEAPIRIIGARNRAILNRQSNGNNRYCLELHADNIRVEGLTCTQAQIGILVNASTARHVQLVGNVCKFNTGNGIKVVPFGTASGEEYQILQNVIQGPSAGIYLQGGPNLYDSRAVFIVENNTILNGATGITILNASANGRRTNLLKNNLIHTTNTQASCILALKGTLHYSDFNDLFAGSGAFVGTEQTTSSGMINYTALSQWRTATGQDANSISMNGGFVNSSSGNLRLRPDSPCVDAGINSFWMFGAKDADGYLRISGHTCDIGAYELYVKSSVRLFLEGPFQTGSDQMACALGQGQMIPSKSPYADDPRVATNIPYNVTDWLLVQFRRMTNGPAVLSRSVLLRNDGWLVNDRGEPDLDVDLPSTNTYFVVIKHRNHLAAMSAVALAFTDQSMTYDFTTNALAYFGGPNGCVAVSNGTKTVWALRAGDSDGDGIVLPVDGSIYESQTNAVGYHRADADLNGIVTPDDYSCIFCNQYTTSSISRPETVLQPALKITPSRQTLTSGETVTLTSSDGSASGTADGSFSGVSTPAFTIETITLPSEENAMNWAFAQNTSDGSLQTNSSSEVTYTAGVATGRTDVVEAWNNSNLLGRAYLNVIGTEAVGTAGKALLIAGRKSVDDTLWPTTDYLADNAYTTLRYRGFSKENILYLSPEPAQDVDGNGELDDIDAEATFTQTALAFTNGVAGSDNLFVYLVDHGGNSSGDGYFRLSASETVTAVQLDAWLDTLQDTSNTKVTVLLDFCYAGSFLHALTYTGTASRIVVAACGTNQPSYFVAGGLVSFSSAFFSGVLLGYDVKQCYEMAQSAMATYQTAQLDDDKDGAYTTDDGAVADGTYIGPTFVASGDAPVIGEVCGNQVLSSETAATLWIGSVSSLHPITRAWCLIVPPGYDPNPDDPVTELPSFDLVFDEESGRYSVTYDGFTTPGTYNIQFYVQDEEDNVSAPRQAYIAQVGYDDRVILIAGGDTNSAAWPAIDYLAQLAYATFQLRLFAPDHICFLSAASFHDLDGDGTNDVSAVSSLAALQDALTCWATTNATDRLTLYLIGEGSENMFHLNGTEYLTTNALAMSVHSYLATNPVPMNIILDFSGAGAFIPPLGDTEFAAEYPEASRIAIASATAYGEALFANGGTVSFSQYLLSSLMTGETLGEAYTAARRAIRRVSGRVRQRAQIDDNLNGEANEKDTDGLVADETYLGSAFVTGADTPVIGSVISPTVLNTPGAPVTLWAAEIAGMYAISNVWCVVTPPGYNGAGNLLELALSWNDTSSRYEAEYSDFVLHGAYSLTFYAQDAVGEISDPLQSEIILADAYEPDDVIGDASLFDGIPQCHTFHSSSDEDWIRFTSIP